MTFLDIDRTSSLSADAPPSDLHFARAIEFAQALIRLPSPSGGEREVADRIVAEMKLLRFDDVWTDAIGNVLGRIRGRGHGHSLMLAGHMDVVGEGHAAGWRCPPLGGQIADGALHGRGSVDVKGPLALQLYAAASLRAARPTGDVYVVATVLEEEGGAGMAYLANEATVVPDGIILAEATGGDLCIGHRGRAEVVIELHGRAAHASVRDEGKNAIALLPRALAVLEEYDLLLPQLAGMGRATVTPTFISTPAQNRNVVPEYVEIVADCRMLPGSTAAGIALELQALFNARLNDPSIIVRPNTMMQLAYTGLIREFTICSPAFALHAAHPFVDRARRAIRKVVGRSPKVRSWRFSTDGGHSCGAHGIPTIGFAPGNEALAHTNREHLDLAEARNVFGAYPALIRALQEDQADTPSWAAAVLATPAVTPMGARS